MKRNDTLKIIAMISMLVDHIGVLFFPGIMIFRTIGRISFPIFAFMLARGYRHTSNRKRYQFRLLLFGIISQIPYIFLNYGLTANYFHFNVILFLLYSTFVLFVLEQMQKGKWNSLLILPLIIMIFLPLYLEVTFDSFAFSYGTYGILMIIIFYTLDKQWARIGVSYLFLSFASTYEYGASVLSTNSEYWLGYKLTYLQALKEWDIVTQNITTVSKGLTRLDGYFFQLRSIFALLLIYYGKSMKKISLNKYVSYTFYPAHITLLILLRIILGG